MKRLGFAFSALLFLWAAATFAHAATREPSLTTVSGETYAQQVVAPQQNRLFMVNFWATWCEPCRTEMPVLLRTAASFKIPLVLVSLDSPNEAKAAKGFLKSVGAQVPTFIVAPGDPQDFIDRVDPHWDGTVPLTVIYRGGKPISRLRGEQEEQDLRKALTPLLKGK